MGEELVIDKINRIFDAVQKEHTQPRASRTATTAVDTSQQVTDSLAADQQAPQQPRTDKHVRILDDSPLR